MQPNFQPVFRLHNRKVLIKMAAHHDKHCCSANATLSKMPGSLSLQNGL